MDYATQIIEALLLAAPVACVVWTITQEEIFKEAREVLQAIQRRYATSLWRRKLAYLPTCPYCCSHYVAAAFVLVFGFKMVAMDWRGYIASLFTVVLIANVYLSTYNLLRVTLRRYRAIADRAEVEVHRSKRMATPNEAQDKRIASVPTRSRDGYVAPDGEAFDWAAHRFPGERRRSVKV